MAKTLRTRTRDGWTTVSRRLTSSEVDSNFLDIDDTLSNVSIIANALERVPVDIAMIGDSRIAGVYNDYVLSPTIPSGVPVEGQYIQILGAYGDFPQNGTGTYQYDHTTGLQRWKHDDDDYGEWVDASVGRHLLESGVIGKALRVLIWRPLTETFEIAVTMGSVRQYYYGGWLLNRHGLTPGVESEYFDYGFHRFGAGGCRTLDTVNMLPWINEESPTPGVDIWWCGTNDISNNVDANLIIDNAYTVFDARRDLGRRIVILGEHARYGADNTTPMTSTQINIHTLYNEGLKEYADTYPNECVYIDTLKLTMDVSSANLIPQANITGSYDMLYDTVHPWLGASIAILPPVLDAIDKFVIPSTKNTISKLDATINDMNGIAWLNHANGTVSGNVTSATGVPYKITVEQTSNVTSSWNITSFESEPGRALEWEYNSTPASTQYTRARTTSLSHFSLANLDLAVGDYFQFMALCEVDAINVNDYIRIYATFSNSTTTTIAEVRAGSAPGVYKLKSAIAQVPLGCTAVLFRIEIWTSTVDNSYGKGRFGKFCFRKIPNGQL